MSVFKDKIRKQILDGKKSWSVSERTPEACDRFEVEVVFPLRELRSEGCIEIRELQGPMPGQYRIHTVMLHGIPNLEKL